MLTEVPHILRPYVLEVSVQPPTSRSAAGVYQVLPGLSSVMGLQYSGRLSVRRDGVAHRLARAGITGLQSGLRLFEPEALTGTILVRFTPAGAWALLGQSMHELADRHEALSDLLPAAMSLEARIEGLGGEQAARLVIEWLLTRQTNALQPIHPALGEALTQIVRSGGTEPVEAIARELVIGKRQLERLFRQQIGVSPKEFASLSRFRQVLTQLPSAANWAELANATGYADQAHFIRSFKARTTLTPGQFLRSQP